MQNRKILASEWFKKAQDDYKSAKVVLNEGGYYGTTCFLAQQMTEKYLKGYLVYHSGNTDKIHDLIKLLNECKKISREFTLLEEHCVLLNDYYIETRYPLDTPVDYKKGEAAKALKLAEKVGSFVMARVDY